MSSLNAPNPVLQREHNIPRTAPLMWSWSILASPFEFSSVLKRIGLEHIAQTLPWCSKISSLKFNEIPYLYFILSCLRFFNILSRSLLYNFFAFALSFARDNSISLYLDRIAAFRAHDLHRKANPSVDDDNFPNSNSGFLFPQVEHRRPSGVVLFSLMTGGCLRRQLAYLRTPRAWDFSGFFFLHSFAYWEAHPLQYGWCPRSVHLLGLKLSSDFSIPHLMHLNTFPSKLCGPLYYGGH